MQPSTSGFRTFAPAKINLFLHVGEKRADGFHELESLVAFANVGDELRFDPSNELSLEIIGPFSSSLGGDQTNIVARAAAALAEKSGMKCAARIKLTKNLPVSSGIGGGSADAAATLRGLTALWKISISTAGLKAIAESLGSDVPVCLASTGSWMEGRGERVARAPALPEMGLVLVNPGVAISTAQVFATLKRRRGLGVVKPRQFPTSDRLLEFLRENSNDLELPARLIAPGIGEALDALKNSEGAELVRMSGSGATAFGLYKEVSKAAAAAANLSRLKPEWWVAAASFLSRSPDQ